MDSELASIQVGAGAPIYLRPPPVLSAEIDAADAPPSDDDPALETCKRELEAVLASLGPESS
ncbi:MAG TPA: hypothetical protein VGI35_07205 [Steroidobacteraceae bacterium]